MTAEPEATGPWTEGERRDALALVNGFRRLAADPRTNADVIELARQTETFVHKALYDRTGAASPGALILAAQVDYLRSTLASALAVLDALVDPTTTEADRAECAISARLLLAGLTSPLTPPPVRKEALHRNYVLHMNEVGCTITP